MAALLALALAAGGILLPPWPLSPDGELVAVQGGGELSAEGAAVAPAGEGLWRVTPAADARRVALAAGGARASAEVGPPPGEIAISAEPELPVKGRDATVAIALEVRGPDGAPDVEAPAPVLVASPGHVSAPVPAGPGRWRATYEPTAGAVPEVAAILALAPRCPLCPTPRAIGGVAIPIAAAVELPGEAEPGTRTTVVVGGRAFGPARADRRGRFRIPLVVPPGVRKARAITLDPAGNRSRTELDLRLRGEARLVCLAFPPALPADGASEASLHCLAANPRAELDPEAPLAAAARAGTVGAVVPWRGALQRARYRAPAGGAGKDDAVVVRLARVAETAVPVALVAGAPERIDLALAREPVPLGATVPAQATVRDARGDLLGHAVGPPRAEAGLLVWDRFVAPRASADWKFRAPLRFELPPGREAATLTLRRDGSRWIATARTVDARPAAGVALRFGSGEGAVTDARGEASARARGPTETVTAPGGARAAGWAGAVPVVPTFAVAREVEVALRPASPVNVVAQLEGRTIAWRIEDADGRPLPGRRVVLRARGVTVGPAEPAGDGGRAAIAEGAGTVAVVDTETGVAAVLEVGP
ncbi:MULTISPECIES: hypothetical protein [Anaeromyxobacter]|uniref:hypothetical protein n=1 Tax=Anaeromyxobacter TaxID=161492 RepID=UPI001F55B520|nr:MULTISPECIES: hypothetical protein [unclassified Anaeromyxobacter]